MVLFAGPVEVDEKIAQPEKNLRDGRTIQFHRPAVIFLGGMGSAPRFVHAQVL